MDNIFRGGYVLSREKNEKPDLIIIATGSEVTLAMEAKTLLTSEYPSIRVVSMPCLDVFLEQPLDYRNSIIHDQVPLVVIEAGVEQGWHVLKSSHLLFIGMNRFGASAPAEVLAEKFGFTGKQVAEKIRSWLN